MVDTLEKFQAGMINPESEDGKKFIHFKRSLYKLYEVKHRSTLEHDTFSFTVDRRNLNSLYKANMEYVNEIATFNEAENQRNISHLKGKAFKAHMLGKGRLRGFGAFALSACIYNNWTYLALMMGNTVPMMAVTFGVVYGVHKFSSVQKEVTAIEFEKEGNHEGWLKVTINEGPFNSKTVFVNPVNMMGIGNYGLDTEDISESHKHIIRISEYEDSDGTVHQEEVVVSMPEDAYREHTAMDWILQKKSEDESETTALYNDLVRQDL